MVTVRLKLIPNSGEPSPKARVAALNGAEYEFHHHSPEFIKAGGTAAQVDALCNFENAATRTTLFDAAERAVIGLTIEMTRAVQVNDSTFAALREALPDDQSRVELVGVIAAYNMVSMTLLTCPRISRIAFQFAPLSLASLPLGPP